MRASGQGALAPGVVIPTMSKTPFDELFGADLMRIKSAILVSFLVPGLAIAGGTLSTSELDVLIKQMPVVRDFLRSSLRFSDSAYAEVRLGPDFVNLSGARTGPYTIDARSAKDGVPLVVVLCTSTRFLDKKGRQLPDAQITQAVSIEEKLTGVMLRQEGNDATQPSC